MGMMNHFNCGIPLKLKGIQMTFMQSVFFYGQITGINNAFNQILIIQFNTIFEANPDYEISQSNMFQERWIPRVKNGGYKDFQLFDLKKDPGQTQNIASDNPALLKKLKAKLLKINQSIMADGVDWHLQ